MGVRYTNILLKDINQDIDLRNDYKYYAFISKCNWNLYTKSNFNNIRLKEILIPMYKNMEFDANMKYKGIPTGRDYIDEDGDIVSYLEITKDSHPDRLKYAIANDNILISSLKGAKSPALYFDKDMSEYVFSNAFYIFSVSEKWNLKFILHILRSNKLKNILDRNLYRGIGISSYKERDFLNIKIPNVDFSLQNKITSIIENIENEIKILKTQYTNSEIIINNILNYKFKLNINKLHELQKEKYNTLTLSNFANNKDMRNSCKFHCKSAQYAYNELKSRFCTKIKDFISEPIVLGASISPSDYDENGECKYLSMATVKNWYYNQEDALAVSEEYRKANVDKSVRKNDIIITRSGVAIGKIALIQNDVDAIFADFTMRIRLKRYNQLFAYYYFRSEFFQELIHTQKKGLQNKNIFPIQIQEFPIPDINLDEQQKIVEEIQEKINKQNIIRKKITELRNKIDEIIYETINSKK